jgi:hypothetical protein
MVGVFAFDTGVLEAWKVAANINGRPKAWELTSLVIVALMTFILTWYVGVTELRKVKKN